MFILHSVYRYFSLSVIVCLVLVPLSAAAAIPALVREALANHPALRSASSLRQAAAAGVESAKWQFWPAPSISMEGVQTGDPAYSGDSRVVTLRLQQPLWTGGRLTGQLDRAEARSLQSELEWQAQRQQLALRVVQAWSEAATAQGKILAYERSREVHSNLQALVQRRVQEGASAVADLNLARTRLESIEAERDAVRAQRDAALERLRLLLGRPLDARTLPVRSQAVTSPVWVDPGSVESLVAAAREESPQLGKARAQAAIAQAEVAIAKAATMPEVYLRAEYQIGSYSASSTGAQGRVFVGLSTSFGAGLSSLSGLAAARAQYEAAVEDIQTQQLAVDEQVRSDASLLATALLRQRSLEKALDSAAEVYASWERQFLAGRKQWQDLMNAAREQTQTEVQLTDAAFTKVLTGWRLLVMARGVDALLKLESEPSEFHTEKSTEGRS